MLRTESIAVEVVADSVSEAHHRFTTMRMIIPWPTLRDILSCKSLVVSLDYRVETISQLMNRITVDPFIPEVINESETSTERNRRTMLWLSGRNAATEQAKDLLSMGFEEYHVREMLSMYSWTTVVVSGTDWSQLFSFFSSLAGCSSETRSVAFEAMKAHRKSEPARLGEAQWHLPFVRSGELTEMKQSVACKVAAARCAVVGDYDQINDWTVDDEIAVFDELMNTRAIGVVEPLRHVATPFTSAERRARRNMAYAARHLPEKPRENNVFGLSNLRLMQLECLTERNGSLEGWTPLTMCIASNGLHTRIERS